MSCGSLALFRRCFVELCLCQLILLQHQDDRTITILTKHNIEALINPREQSFINMQTLALSSVTTEPKQNHSMNECFLHFLFQTFVDVKHVSSKKAALELAPI